MVERHHRLNGHEFEQAPGDSEGQGSLTCCVPWGRRVRHDLASELKEAPGIRFAFKFNQSGFPGSSVVKNPPACAGDMGSISGSGRSPGEGNGNTCQYSCREIT